MSPLLKSRLTLLLVAALFFTSFGIALYLVRSGWQPTATRNAGELFDPPPALGHLTLTDAEGSPYPWNPEQRLWRVVVVPPDNCAATECASFLAMLQRIWVAEGRHADRVHMLWFGPVPEGAPAGVDFRALRPMSPSAELHATLPGLSPQGDLSVYVLDPSGYLVLRYAPGFDPSGLRKDLARLLKVTE